jgi:heat shock protein HslJ
MAAAGIRALAGFAIAATMGCTSIVVDARTFEGTRWQVLRINGQDVPPDGSFELTFLTHGRFSGRMGCNSASGVYQVDGDTLVPTGVGTTEMACDYSADAPHPVPLMAWERWGFAVLSRPMRMTWNSGDRLTLRNASGSIELRRVSP